MQPPSTTARNRAGSVQALAEIELDPAHHLAGPFLPQTPLGSGYSTPVRPGSPVDEHRQSAAPIKPWLYWMIYPSASFKVLLVPLVLYVNWELLAPLLWRYVGPTLEPYLGIYPQPGHMPNPFSHFFLLSGHIPTSSPDDPRYQKTYGDLAFIAYNIVFWSFFRQFIAVDVCRPIARYFGIKKEGKLRRFGEQGHALIYWSIMGAWGLRIMSQMPTWWYRTEYFWIDYPHWDIKPELKCYYLMQMSFWTQQLLVLVLRLEKPRKDYWELVAHHLITMWMVGFSYFMNMTYIGQAIFMSMDIPDAFLAFSKLLNYIQWERAKVVSFVVFIPVWTYFRHYLNWHILYAVATIYRHLPEESGQWNSKAGAYFVPWMRDQVFLGIFLLQLIQLFWYYLILRILYRSVMTSKTRDDRSDDEDDHDEKKES